MPSNPADAKGLMKTALRAGEPVIMLETKALFASKGEVPVGEHFVPFGVAEIVRDGRRHHHRLGGPARASRAGGGRDARAARASSARSSTSARIMPLDVETVAESVRKTHRLLVVDEG